MKIKQQKIIKNFLFSELDTEVAQKIFDEQNNILDKIILNAFNKTKNQLKTLKNTILPRIALYKALNNYGFSIEDSNNHMKNYMLNYIAKSKHNSMVKMEKVPGFYSLYSKIFLKIMRRLIYSKVNKNTMQNLLMSQLQNVYGIRLALKMNVLNFVVYFVMLTI